MYTYTTRVYGDTLRLQVCCTPQIECVRSGTHSIDLRKHEFLGCCRDFLRVCLE